MDQKGSRYGEDMLKMEPIPEFVSRASDHKIHRIVCTLSAWGVYSNAGAEF